jgi:hypothetical protein
LVLWILTALVVGMLAVDAMQMAQLVELTVLGRALLISARVLVAGAISFKVAMIALRVDLPPQVDLLSRLQCHVQL